MLSWIVPGHLAVSPRPGFRSGPETSVPKDTVEAWLRDKRHRGIASILCLLDRDQLPLYERALPHGLLAFYREHGFDVGHVPTQDQQTHPFSDEQYERIWQAFVELPKPVLVHCSAGMDRSGRAIRHILAQLEADQADAAS